VAAAKGSARLPPRRIVGTDKMLISLQPQTLHGQNNSLTDQARYSTKTSVRSTDCSYSEATILEEACEIFSPYSIASSCSKAARTRHPKATADMSGLETSATWQDKI
jgi:hypothetical protein